MKITFYDIFRYLRSVLDAEHQSELVFFITAFILQRLQYYTSIFPESMSYTMDISEDNVDFFVLRYFLKCYINDKCGEFVPQSLMLCLQFLDAYILSQFGENLSETSSLKC